MKYLHRVHEGDDPQPGLNFHTVRGGGKGWVVRLRVGSHVWRFRHRTRMRPHLLFSHNKYDFSWTDPEIIPEALPVLRSYRKLGNYWARILGVRRFIRDDK